MNKQCLGLLTPLWSLRGSHIKNNQKTIPKLWVHGKGIQKVTASSSWRTPDPSPIFSASFPIIGLTTSFSGTIRSQVTNLQFVKVLEEIFKGHPAKEIIQWEHSSHLFYIAFLCSLTIKSNKLTKTLHHHQTVDWVFASHYQTTVSTHWTYGKKKSFRRIEIIKKSMNIPVWFWEEQ